MTILRYTASADNTITNAYNSSLVSRGTGSNMGASDILEVFSIYGNATTTSVELSRILIQFPIDKIKEDRDLGNLPAAGKPTFKLKLYNAPHYQATPRNFVLQVSAVSASWQEGAGLDMEGYSDVVASGSHGSNWVTASSHQAWNKAGGDYHSSPVYTQTFKTGLEDLSIDVSPLVEQWITTETDGTTAAPSSGKRNYGFGIRLTNDYEGYFSGSTDAEMSGTVNIHNITGSTKSYYTKKFFARGTEFFYKQPVIEAQFDDSIKDNRGNFYLSSSLLTSTEIMNNLYFYNYYRGKLRDIAGKSTALPQIRLYYSSGSKPEGERRGFLNSSLSPVHHITASRTATGIYKASIAASSSIISTTYPYLVDVWSFLGEEVLTGSVITPIKYRPSSFQDNNDYVLSMPGLKKEYSKRDNIRFRLYARQKNWSPNIYNVAKNKPQNLTLVSSSYRVIRVIDDLEVSSHGYADPKYSLLSHDVSGNFFNFKMNLLEPGYQYGFKFSVYDDYSNSFVEQPYLFKFRVV